MSTTFWWLSVHTDFLKDEAASEESVGREKPYEIGCLLQVFCAGGGSWSQVNLLT